MTGVSTVARAACGTLVLAREEAGAVVRDDLHGLLISDGEEWGPFRPKYWPSKGWWWSAYDVRKLKEMMVRAEERMVEWMSEELGMDLEGDEAGS